MADEDSPTRPRQHILETLSKRAFVQQLPASWVERDLPEDYGIDYEIEVFEDGTRTGLTFKVQLKSTDSDSSSLSLKVTDFAYWATLDAPVLIVLYKDDTQELLSKWAHAHNPWPLPDGQRTTTVHFTTPLPEQLDRAVRDLARMREVRASVLRGPVTLAVRDADSAAALSLRHALRAKVDELGAKRLVTIVNEDDAHATVSRHNDKLTVAGPAEMTSVTLHNVSAGDITEGIPDVLATVSVLLLQLGADQVAAELLVRVRGGVANAVVEGLAVPMATVFAAARKWVELAALIDSAPSPDSADEMFSVAVMATSVMDGAAAQMFVDRARASAEELHSHGHDEHAARWLFMAVFIGVDHCLWVEVDTMLARVAELTDGFENDSHFFELAGKARWHIDDHAAALAHYRRAWDLGWRSEQAIAALGEALIVGGFYSQARDHFAAADSADLTRWATLLQCVVEDVLEIVGVDEQTRVPFTEEDAHVEDVDDADELLGLLQERDAINAAVLDRYTHASEVVSLGVVVWTAVITEDPGRWALAIIVAAMTEADEQLVKAIVEAAALEHPEVVEELKSVQHELSGPLPDGFLERAATYAVQATPYEGPEALQFRVEDILDHA